MDSAGEQRADYWRNRAAPYLKSIWPKTPDAISEAVVENLGRAGIAAGEAFPEAAGQIRAWLRPVHFPGRVARALHQARLDARCPEAALDLLHRIVSDETARYFGELAACLTVIRASELELEGDHRFQRLLEILRANGGDLG